MKSGTDARDFRDRRHSDLNADDAQESAAASAEIRNAPPRPRGRSTLRPEGRKTGSTTTKIAPCTTRLFQARNVLDCRAQPKIVCVQIGQRMGALES